MEIRVSKPPDIPAIVNLLKLSLGETLMPKSVKYWQWKHIDNPFGQSPVLLAFEAGELVGVRAFMCWQWIRQENKIVSVRAVDTATHPQHQGKGIFKKLTLELVEQCKLEQVNFVFNTPNKQSKPGYLKMGWQEAGRLPIRFRIKPMQLIRNLTSRRISLPPPDQSLSQLFLTDKLDFLLKAHIENNKDHIVTNHSVQSLAWRYQHVPVVDYFCAVVTEGNELKAVAFYRFKVSRAGLELRVTDTFVESPRYEMQLQQNLLTIAEAQQASYITISAKTINRLFSMAPSIKTGPVVTVRGLDNGPTQQLVSFNMWNPSIGDLELF